MKTIDGERESECVSTNFQIVDRQQIRLAQIIQLKCMHFDSRHVMVWCSTHIQLNFQYPMICSMLNALRLAIVSSISKKKEHSRGLYVQHILPIGVYSSFIVVAQKHYGSFRWSENFCLQYKWIEF